MNIGESIRIAFRGLSANKMRSLLTMLGIVIGVAAVIALVSIGEGVQSFVASSFQGLGSNLLFVMPGNLSMRQAMSGSGVAFLTMADVAALEDERRAPDVGLIAPESSGTKSVTYGGEKILITIKGVTPEYTIVRNFHPQIGAFFGEAEVKSRARVAVLGQDVVEELFPAGTYPIGETIKIDGTPFRVIGVMEKKGGTGFGSQDEVVFVPITTAQARLFPERSLRGEPVVSLISVKTVSESSIAAASAQITRALRQTHRLAASDEDDFSVINQTDVVNIAGQITGILTIFLGAIAGISLLVGGIGIMNIMLVSVTERTREIGIRKAVGAKRRDILVQFLIEAMVLSTIGGLIGIALGALGSRAISQLMEDMTTVVSVQAVLMAVGFSAAVGLFFGIYPAMRAARLHPIEALRYE
ncbi:MAG: ABC transporter permease [Anaerolineae bacterium]|jgi:putative ABC transport system permease protein|nr:ABC transporter permease [Anaerolineae bacterium]MDH7472901.1 ABC transporter permease [Anaerolineae bacterium]